MHPKKFFKNTFKNKFNTEFKKHVSKNLRPNMLYSSFSKQQDEYDVYKNEYLFRKLIDKEHDMRDISLEDMSFDHQIAILKFIYRYPNREALNPMVAEFMKEKMYNLHISNPQVFTFKKLAHIFGVPRQRVRAIVFLKIEEHQRRREGLLLYGNQIEQQLEETFGVLINGRVKKKFLSFINQHHSSHLYIQLNLESQINTFSSSFNYNAFLKNFLFVVRKKNYNKESLIIILSPSNS